MRAKDDPTCIEFLMRIGDGRETTNDKGEIKILRPMIKPYSSIYESLETLIENVYRDMSLFETAPFEMMKRSILCPKNEFVNDINLNSLKGSPIMRVKTGKDVKVLIVPPTSRDPGTTYTTNVIYNEVLVKASIT
ncbi:hypothetical protein LIER_32153 [Lithospermum erythrorhizon]|uniref:DNA helicase n=1 Tax=Lithospermum erythrorhizon TaxID=34254 RepID=A0AAV3RWI8_LITER